MNVNEIVRPVGSLAARSKARLSPRTARFGVLLVGLLLLGPAVSAKRSKCFPREGRCVAVQVNGQASTEVAKSTKKMLKDLEDLHFYVKYTLYELPEPVNGRFEILADGVEGSEEWFGRVLDVEATVIPLQQVELETHRERSVETTVKIGEGNAVVEQDVLEENRLPAGRYLLVVRVKGTDNWDRQVLYFEVAEP